MCPATHANYASRTERWDCEEAFTIMLRYATLPRLCVRERLLTEPPGRRRRVGQLDFLEGHDGAAYQAGTPVGSMGAWEHGSMGACGSMGHELGFAMRRECGYDFCGRPLLSRLRVLKSASSARLHALRLSQQIARAAPSVRGARHSARAVACALPRLCQRVLVDCKLRWAPRR